MFWVIFTVIFIALLITAWLVLRNDRKRMEARQPKYRVEKTHYILENQERIEEFINAYDEQFIVNDEYNYRQRRLTEEFYGEKVNKYSSAYLPSQIEGNEVYSKLNGEWVRVGTLGNDAELTEYKQLMLNMNEYKDVRNTSIQKVKGEPYFEMVVSHRIPL